MSARKKATDAELLAAYADLKSVWAVGARFKMAGQSVHERLFALGVVKPVNAFTEAEREILHAEYEAHASAGRLGDLAERMGRTKAFLCRQARRLGLTRQDRPMPESVRAGASQRQRDNLAKNGHPRGMAGKRHAAATRDRLSLAQAALWEAMPQAERDQRTHKQALGRAAAGTKPTPRPGASWKAGWREIGGQRCYFRSRWEANYARYLEWLRERGEIETWEHEPETFWFEGIKRGSMSYLPDFRVAERGGAVAYHEVKGWMDSRSKTKIARMARYHPKVRLIVIDKKAYGAIARQVSSLVGGWE